MIVNDPGDTTDDSAVELSVVIPIYNSAGCLQELHDRLTGVLEDISETYEIIMVDDASPDESWAAMQDLHARDPRVKIVQQMRNFGQHKAILCGMQYASGEFVITMDDDLQHPPEEIPKLVDGLRNDDTLDVVIGSYDVKQHSWFRNLGSKAVHAATSYVFARGKGLKFTSFRIMRRNVVRGILRHRIDCPRISQIILLTTNRIANVSVRHDPRGHGRSGYTVGRLVSDALDNILSNSSLPLQIVSYVGFLCSLLSVALGVYYLYKYLFVGVGIAGWTTIVLLMLFFFGILFFSVGIVGEYLIRILREAKRSPRYLTRNKEL